jgi:hypothetical protein
LVSSNSSIPRLMWFDFSKLSWLAETRQKSKWQQGWWYRLMYIKINDCGIFYFICWLTVTEYMWHKRPRICSTCYKHFPVLSSFINYHRVCN